MASRSQKEPTAFRTISEASEELGVAQHVLRHWEDVFSPVRPMRRAGGRRLYRVQDIELLRGIKRLLHDEGYTTKGVQKILKSDGADHVSAIGRGDVAPSSAGTKGDEATALLNEFQLLLKDIGSLKKSVQRIA
ncbi:MerR family transcriptional regulator [Parvularcula sp. ZS-1/3]|uniref:MerR family transcriptional regulator n=1 Tax=Parvularcula mediterranea TaxID=2732508 RepID=A0A7Y3RMK7_9PROT|nr:MerR family transcriptional regulator [Parvularcula mediterranea]NNU16789.1 MerR family transcriptional regulator [Parvularcula mediterranea]